MRDILKAGLPALGVSCGETELERLETYFGRLVETNKVMNLTAITDETEAARLHFLDSAALLPLLRGESLIDVGTGAGFPGLVLKILAPQLKLTLFDSLQKRLDFLKSLSAELGLKDVETVHGRAEEAGHEPALREKFDCATARAVARLDVLCELCIPFLRVGGRFLAMKAADSEAEAETAVPAARRLGAELSETFEYTIPETDVLRRVYVFEKKRPTPDAYPRRWSKLKKL